MLVAHNVSIVLFSIMLGLESALIMLMLQRERENSFLQGMLGLIEAVEKSYMQ